MYKRIELNLKNIVTLAVFFIASVTLFAQDTIVLRNGNEIQALVLEVGVNDIKYKRADNPDGPIYTLEKLKISLIRYTNGSEEVFDDIDSSATPDGNQQPAPPILSYSNGVYQNGYKIPPYQVQEIMSADKEALKRYNGGRTLYLVGRTIAYPCAFLLGWDLGTRIAGGEGNGALLGVGVGGLAVGFILSNLGDNKMKTSVQLYNSKINKETSYQIDFGFTQSGVGFCMKF